MKTLVCLSPGQFEYQSVETPSTQPGFSLLRIKRIGICGTDLHAYQGNQPFFSYPRILGHELSADVLTTDHPDFKPGDAVTIIPYFHCGTCIACRKDKTNCCKQMQVSGVHIDGGMTEQLLVPSYALVKSEGLSYDELALVEPLAIGAHGIRRANVTPDEFVLVIGAGPIGLGTMEFARIAGAKVIAMDVNDDRLSFCRQTLHVDYTLNPKRENPLEQLERITNGEMPTVVIDATGNLNAINAGFSYLAHGGRYVLIGLQKEAITLSHPEFHKREATLMSSRNATRADFVHVMDCLRKGLVSPANYITHRVDFNQVKDRFEDFLKPENKVIKALIDLS
ncbi:alcohol dehydrogenase [Siphonobacter sp. BAB-5405]|uniref:zinc-binding alcohol dehydrogenase family protein n=1 Tax=Siphonobacter sp. BAB-5405 TaxID=1864825 RepID=UPI000C802E79|nr:zinc-binding alcohol dehydrogenase family protein [Siphonobacter sp. BAB-5405]PMD87092.1 alcohol dehydrogenase [Siphonobacter sp. BAB-5405]